MTLMSCLCQRPVGRGKPSGGVRGGLGRLWDKRESQEGSERVRAGDRTGTVSGNIGLTTWKKVTTHPVAFSDLAKILCLPRARSMEGKKGS